MTLTDFLLARIAEDEAVAREAMVGEYGPRADGSGEWRMVEYDHEGIWPEEPAESYGYGYVSDESWAIHAERHDPARVLAECEAKRRIVEAFEEERVRRDIYNRDYDSGEYDFNENDLRARLASNAECRGLEIAMQAHAAIYADHPDYREEWKP